jgi:hypothetical protein
MTKNTEKCCLLTIGTVSFLTTICSALVAAVWLYPTFMFQTVATMLIIKALGIWIKALW